MQVTGFLRVGPEDGSFRSSGPARAEVSAEHRMGNGIEQPGSMNTEVVSGVPDASKSAYSRYYPN